GGGGAGGGGGGGAAARVVGRSHAAGRRALPRRRTLGDARVPLRDPRRLRRRARAARARWCGAQPPEREHAGGTRRAGRSLRGGEALSPARDPGDELVDVVDDDGRPVAVVTRREMRARRLPHRSTYILVFDTRGWLFVHLRTATKDVYPSHWDPCAGGVLTSGEDFAVGAARELAEELGVDAPLEELFPFRWQDAFNVVHGMAYRVVHDGPFRLQP